MTATASEAIRAFELDGAWEVTFLYTRGEGHELNAPIQAFLAVRKGRAVGLDALGTLWMGSFTWLNTDKIVSEMVFDPSGLADVFVTNSQGEAVSHRVQHRLVLNVVEVGDQLVATGGLQLGEVRIEGTMTRRRRFDGANI